MENAFQVIDGIDLQPIIQQLQSSLSEKGPVKNALLFEAVYLRIKCLQKLDKCTGINHYFNY